MYVIGCYLSYLALSLAVTIWVARALHKNGRVFLVDAFHGNAELADSVNRTLVAGCCLASLGWVATTLRTQPGLENFRSAAELVLEKTGAFLLLLAIVYYLYFIILSKMRNRTIKGATPNSTAAPSR